MNINRVCDEHNAKRACVFLQCLLELWHPAVELALTFDTKLAQQTASQPNDRELQRKLWLLIAENEIKGKNDVKEALELLKECDLLRIEDLLPFFDDFQKIDHFKEVICDALKVNFSTHLLKNHLISDSPFVYVYFSCPGIQRKDSRATR